MHRLDQIAIRLVVGIVLLALGSLIAGGGLAIYEQVATWRKASRIQRQLGFAGHSQLIVDKNQPRPALIVDTVALGGPFDVAGAQPGDVVLCEKGVPAFYDMIAENRGRDITLTVAAGAELQPWEKCTPRQLEVTVPK
jgi:hypothetical protein